jgi:TonB-dependent receptor
VEPSGGQAGQIVVDVGNPNLKPTESVNYDASLEYYGVKDAVFELGAYYKSIKNFIYTASATGSALSSGGGSATASLPAGIVVPSGYTVMVNAPENGPSAYVEGLTFNAQQRLSFLAGLARGLGYRANVTVQHSDTKLGGALPQSPDLIYNLEGTYELHGVHADLTYQYTGLQLVNLGNSNDGNLSQYLQPTAFLNLSIGYRFGPTDITFQAKNLTDSPTFWKTVGKSDRYLGVQDGDGNGSYIKFGPTFSLTATYNF